MLQRQGLPDGNFLCLQAIFLLWLRLSISCFLFILHLLLLLIVAVYGEIDRRLVVPVRR